MTIALRPAGASDAAWLETWLPAVARSLAFELGDIPSWLRGARARIIERDGSDAGVVSWRPHTSMRKAALIELVATPQAYARRGTGMAAAAQLEHELHAAGVRTVYAPAADAHGISMYFWIRLGYRPLLRTEWPCERMGTAWLMREI